MISWGSVNLIFTECRTMYWWTMRRFLGVRCAINREPFEAVPVLNLLFLICQVFRHLQSTFKLQTAMTGEQTFRGLLISPEALKSITTWLNGNQTMILLCSISSTMSQTPTLLHWRWIYRDGRLFNSAWRQSTTLDQVAPVLQRVQEFVSPPWDVSFTNTVNVDFPLFFKTPDLVLALWRGINH